MSRPSVLLVAPIYDRPIYGAAYAAALLKRGLIARGFDVYHVNTRFVAKGRDLGKPSARKVLLFLLYLMQLVTLGVTKRPRIVIICPSFNRGAFLKDAAFSWTCFCLRLRVVWWCHAWGGERLFARSGRFSRTLMRMTGARVKTCVVVGSRQVTDVSCICSEGAVMVLHYGIPDEFGGESDSGSASDVVRITYLSNLERSKGWQVLFRAAERICRERSNVRFEFYGNAGTDTTADEIAGVFAASPCSSSIQYHGPVYGAAKTEALRSASIFCFPTFYPIETFGLVLLEAMSAGLPVVATDHASIPDAVIPGCGGILVTPEDVDTLMAALCGLIDRPQLRASMGAFNRTRFLGHFTTEQFIDRWVDFLAAVQ